MRPGSAITGAELEELVGEYRHVHEEHRRTRRGSRVRRHLRARLDQLGSRFDRLLAEAVSDERERERWREHLYHRATEPRPPEAPPPLLFRGRSEAGSVLEILERADGALDVLIDGVRVERLDAADELLATAPRLTFYFGEAAFTESFTASAAALDALLGSIESGGSPPEDHARELLLDGLIDRNFGLTARGRRARKLERQRRPKHEQGSRRCFR